MTPEEKERVERAITDAQSSDDIAGGQQRELQVRRQGELDWHDRLMARGAANASRDALHDGNSGKQPGDYTVYEARDRAAHTPHISVRDREE